MPLSYFHSINFDNKTHQQHKEILQISNLFSFMVFLCKSLDYFAMNGTKLFTLIILNIILNMNVIAQVRNLDFYVNQALENSPLLKEYSNQVFSVGIDSQKLKANYKPQVNAIANNTFSPVINGFGYDEVLSNSGSYNEIINVNKTFAGKSNLNTQLNSFKLLHDSITNIRKITEQELKKTIITQYINTYGDLQQIHFYTDVLTTLKQQVEIIKSMTQNNIYRQTDYLTFLITLKQQELQIKQLKIQYNYNFAMLNYECGLFDTSATELERPEIILSQLPDVNNSPFFIRFTIDSLTLCNNLNLIKYSYKPKLNAFANAGFSSSFLYNAYKNFGYSFGFNLNIPIYDGHQKKMQEQKIGILQQTTANYKTYFANQYRQNIALLYQQLQSTNALIKDINEQVAYSQTLITANSKLLETGDVKIADLILSLNGYLAVKNLLTQNSINKMQITNQINYWYK